MEGVWQALLQAESPRDIVDRKVPGVDAMQAARDEVTAEVNRCARTPPKFSADGGRLSDILWSLLGEALRAHVSSRSGWMCLHVP